MMPAGGAPGIPPRGAAMAAEAREASMQVEVELYSGRPNPQFTLPPAVAAELRRRLAALPPAAADAPGPRDGLGYRGLRIVGGADAAAVVVSAGSVEIEDRAGGVTRRADPGRGLERWLVEAAGGQLPPDAHDALRQDLAR